MSIRSLQLRKSFEAAAGDTERRRRVCERPPPRSEAAGAHGAQRAAAGGKARGRWQARVAGRGSVVVCVEEEERNLVTDKWGPYVMGSTEEFRESVSGTCERCAHFF